MTNIQQIRNLSVEELARFLVRVSSPIPNEEIDNELVEEAIMFLNNEYEIKKVEVEIDDDSENELSSINDNVSNLKGGE